MVNKNAGILKIFMFKNKDNKKQNKNILVTKFPHESTFGGEEIYTLGLFSALQSRGFDFYLLSSCPYFFKKFQNRNWHAKKLNLSKEPLTKLSTIIFLLTAPYLFFKLLWQLFYFRFFKKTKILYCLTFGEKILGFIPAKIFGYKIFWVELVSPKHWLTKNPLRIFYKLYSKKVKILVPCEHLKNELEECKITKNNIKIIHQGIDLEKYKIDEKTLLTNKEYFEVGTVLRLTQEKAAGYLFQALKQTVQIMPNILLTIVTEQSEKNNLQWLSKQLEIEHLVKIVPLQKDIQKWFKDFDVFVMPDKSDFSSMSILEAMACGVAVIADDSCGASDIIQNSLNGILTDTSNPEKISQALIYLYNNPDKRNQMIIEAYKKVAARFTIDKMVGEFISLLE